jgi:hypothetical protein
MGLSARDRHLVEDRGCPAAGRKGGALQKKSSPARGPWRVVRWTIASHTLGRGALIGDGADSSSASSRSPVPMQSSSSPSTRVMPTCAANYVASAV